MNKLFFIHIPKNAGTSLNQVIKKNYRRVLKVSWKLEHEHYYQKLLASDNIFDNYDVISGHYPYGMHIGDKTNYEPVYFTMLRDPIRRVLSTYNYLKFDSTYVISDEKLHKYLNKLTLTQFLIKHHSLIPNHILIDNGQVRYLSGIGDTKPFGSLSEEDLEKAKINLSKMAFGITEEFNKSMLYLKNEAIFKHILYLSRNVGTAAQYKLSEQEESLIRERNKLDIELYDFALSLFNEKTKQISRIQRLKYKYELQVYGFFIKAREKLVTLKNKKVV